MLIQNSENKKVVGEIKGSVYCKSVKKSKHFFRKYSGYAISDSILEMLKEKGVKKIVLTETENKEKFEVELEKFLEKGKPICFGTDEQTCLPIYHWRKI